MEDDADIVNVGVEVIEKLPVIDRCQFVTCTEEIFADIVDKSSFFHPNIYYIWLVTCKLYILRRLVEVNQVNAPRSNFFQPLTTAALSRQNLKSSNSFVIFGP